MRGLVTDKWETRKLEALWLRTEKKNLQEISTITGLHKQTVYDVIRKYHEQGLETAIKSCRGRHKKQVRLRYSSVRYIPALDMICL